MTMCETCKNNREHLAEDCEFASGSCTCQHRTKSQKEVERLGSRLREMLENEPTRLQQAPMLPKLPGTLPDGPLAKMHAQKDGRTSRSLRKVWRRRA